MNANPSSAASVGASPNAGRLQGTPALQSAVVRAPERTRATSLETFDVYRASLDACRGCQPIAPASRLGFVEPFALTKTDGVGIGFGSSAPAALLLPAEDHPVQAEQDHGAEDGHQPP